MTLRLIRHIPFMLLPSGILIVEPHEGRLAARAMLLEAADHYASVSGILDSKPRVRRRGYDVAIAILSETLGHDTLSALAQQVRKRWPSARILIFGRQEEAIEERLHDARIDHRARPEELLAALLVLSNDFGNASASPRFADGRDVNSLPTESNSTRSIATSACAR